MGVLGVLTCEILELECAHLLATDSDVAGITVLEDVGSERLVAALESKALKKVQRIPDINRFTPSRAGHLEVLVQVLELALHDRKEKLQQGLVQAAREMSPHVDALFLGYGLCGNALEKPDELLSEAGVPVFIPMDDGHPVDDCVGLIIGGRECYYNELCKVAGTFFMIPGWAYHWRRIFDKDFGNMGMDIAKRLFAHYERSLLVLTPIMPEHEMRQNAEQFSGLFGFRVEAREGTLNILSETWKEAKEFLKSEAD